MRSRPPDDGLEGLPEDVLRAVVTAVLAEARHSRAAIHRLRRVDTCDTRLAVTDFRRLVVSGDCVCRDFLLDMLHEADRFLVRRKSASLHNPPGAVRFHIRLRTSEWIRQRRLESGTQVRTDRIRTGAVAARLPDDYHRAVLEYLVLEAGSIAPLGDECGLHRRLAELAAAELGGTPNEHLHRTVAALPAVEAAGRAGRRVRAQPDSDELVTWWERYIERPLGRRDRIDAVPLDLLAEQEERPVGEDVGSTAMAIVLRLAARQPDEHLEVTLSEAVDEMIRCDLLPAAAARRFLDDPGRVRVAVEQMSVLLAA